MNETIENDDVVEIVGGEMDGFRGTFEETTVRLVHLDSDTWYEVPDNVALKLIRRAY